MRTRVRISVLCLTLVATVDWPSIALAIPYALYGHEHNDEGRCAATAIFNSFVYLSNSRHDLYDKTQLLTGTSEDLNHDGVVNNADQIRALDGLMGGGGCGVNPAQAWFGKTRWLLLLAPGTTVLHSMAKDIDFPGGNTEPGFPDTNFILRMLRNNEDLELAFDLADGTAHIVTAIDLTFTTGGVPLLSYIDPNCPLGTNRNNRQGGPSTVVLETSASGQLQFDWRNGDLEFCEPTADNPAIRASITVAFAESAIPQPSTLVLMASGALGLLIVFLRRQVSRLFRLPASRELQARGLQDRRPAKVSSKAPARLVSRLSALDQGFPRGS